MSERDCSSSSCRSRLIDKIFYKPHFPKIFNFIITCKANLFMLNLQERKDTLNEELQKWLAGVTEGEAKITGILLGKKSAKAILQLRKNDGYDANGKFMSVDKPGYYQITPGFKAVSMPDLARIKLFGLRSVSQFRSPLPPALNSAEYAAAYNEVKEYGCINSKVRTKDQTSYAHW
jgi:hypothetical protein